MKRIGMLIIMSLALMILPSKSLAAGGIYASGGGSHVEGETFSVSVKASGVTFNAFQGSISVSGPVTVVSVSAGSATWVKQPSNGGQFVGMVTSATSSLTVATVKVKGTKPGSGSVSVGGVSLANNGSVVGSGGSSASFTITKAPLVPGSITVTSTSHPDPAQKYDATTIVMNWTAPANGATGYSYLLDQIADTAPAQKTISANATASFENQKIGTYYFHIRGQNADGWGPTTHFTINIKEPENKVENKLSTPKNVKIGKSKDFKNDVKIGMVTGLVIKGSIPTKAIMEKYVLALDSVQALDPILVEKAAVYSANIVFTPTLTVPEGKSLSVTPDKNGNFRLVLDYPIPSGFHKISIQGQRAKILTKAYESTFEVSQKNGGQVILLSAKDAKVAPIIKPNFWQKYKIEIMSGAAVLVGEIVILGILLLLRFTLKRKPKNEKKKTKGFDWDK